jgi:hypothetical protein
MCLLKKTKKIDNPDALKTFLDKLESMDWTQQNRETLKKLFQELNSLIYSDVDYYAGARQRHSTRSTWMRWVAIFFGTVGVLAPLLGGANDIFKPYVGWGYPALAIAGAAMLIDRSFGYTRGHIRYVIARLELKHMMINFQVQWSLWLVQTTEPELEQDQLTKAGELLQLFVTSAHKVVMAETAVWGIAVVEDMQELKNLIGQRAQTTPANQDKPA